VDVEDDDELEDELDEVDKVEDELDDGRDVLGTELGAASNAGGEDPCAPAGSRTVGESTSTKGARRAAGRTTARRTGAIASDSTSCIAPAPSARLGALSERPSSWGLKAP
jgi:hypothetical protein